jgi:hypothetical protein
MKLIGFLTCILATQASLIRNSLNCIDLLYNNTVSVGTRILWGNGNPIGSIGSIGNDTYLCFRGTLSLFDWISDLDADLVRYPYGGHVSRGFLGLYVQPYYLTVTRNVCTWPPIWGYCVTDSGIQEVLRKTSIREEVLDFRIDVIAGHSLGAALATLAAMDAMGSRFVFGFGSPMVGDPEFAKMYNTKGPRTYLIHTIDDIVPNFPMPCYRHVCNRTILDMEPGVCDIHRAHSMERYWNSLDLLESLVAS